jgi:hypothetical protein
MEIAAYLPTLYLLVTCVVEHIYPFGATYHPVEMVGVGALLMFVGWQLESLAEGIGNKRI